MEEKQTQNAEFQPSEVKAISMAVIEYKYRTIGANEWYIWGIYDNTLELEETYLRERCESLAKRMPENEWRYRRGTLTLEPSDKCEIFKSE